MTNGKKFTHSGVILNYKLYNSDEGCLNLKVKTKLGELNFECFVHSETSAQLYRGQFKDNDEVTVSFDFLTANFDSHGMPLTFVVSDTKKKNVQKNLERIGDPLGCNSFYIVEGRIIKIFSPKNPELAKHNDYAVLDCGIYLCADIPKEARFKIGDYIKLNGRLDAHIVGKVE